MAELLADFWLMLVVTSAVFGAAGYLFAKKTNRVTWHWICYGVLLNFLVLLLMAVVGPKTRRMAR
jgi:hypothetical protein